MAITFSLLSPLNLAKEMIFFKIFLMDEYNKQVFFTTKTSYKIWFSKPPTI